MKRLNSRGFGHLLVLVAIVVILVVGFVGWRVTRVSSPDTTAASTGTSKTSVPASIKNTSDLQKASNALDSAPIDKNLDTTSLDGAVNNLL